MAWLNSGVFSTLSVKLSGWSSNDWVLGLFIIVFANGQKGRLRNRCVDLWVCLVGKVVGGRVNKPTVELCGLSVAG